MMTVSDRFEDRLLRELRQIVVEGESPTAPARIRSRRTRVAWGAAGVLAASAAIAVVATTGDVTSSAYAVEPRSDGAVTVSIHRLDDASGLQRSLAAAGIPAVVDFSGHVTTACGIGALGKDGQPVAPAHVIGSRGEVAAEGVTATKNDDAFPAPGATASGPGEALTTPPSTAVVVAASPVEVGPDGATFTIDPSAIKAGQKVYVTGDGGAIGSIDTTVSANVIAAACPAGPVVTSP